MILSTGGACVVSRGGRAWLPGGGACVGYDEIRSMSGWYASYWNAFLFLLFFDVTCEQYQKSIFKRKEKD